MKSSKALVIFLMLAIAGVLGIGIFNFAVNPLCYFRCENITLGRQTVNSYYQNAQRILQFPDTELIVLGSSRGESLPLAWLAESTQMKALNLSVGGAEIHAETAFLEFARQNLKLKKVIWIADYFSLIEETAGDKIRFTQALRALDPDLKTSTIAEALKKASLLLDHNTIEASFSLLKKSRKAPEPPHRGASAGLGAVRCEADLKKSKLTMVGLQKEIGILFDGYAHKILQPAQNENAYARLKTISDGLRKSGIEFIVLIPGYHPAFWARLKNEFPQIAERHTVWVKRLLELTSPGVKVLNFFYGLPGDDGSPLYWSDAVHFSCLGAMRMLGTGL